MFGQLGTGGVLAKIWHYGRWPLLVIFLVYVALAVYRTPNVDLQGTEDVEDAMTRSL